MPLVVGFGAMTGLYIGAIKATTAANAIFLQYTAPVYVLVFEPLIFKEKYRRSDFLVVAACAAGIALFFVGRMVWKKKAVGSGP